MKVTLVHGNLSPKTTAVAIGIPNGIGVIAAYLEALGHRVEIVDAPILELTVEETARRVEESRPDVVGITAMTPSFPTAAELGRLVKEALPGVPLLFGGPHVHFTAEETLLRHPWIDACCRGDGEEAMAEVVSRLAVGDRNLEGIPGLSYRSDGRVVHEPEPRRIPIEELPMTAYHLLPMELYRQRQEGDFSETFSPVRVIASRGCPYPCSFCLVPRLFDRTYRFRNPERVVDELEVLHRRHRITAFKFADDTLTIHKQKVIDLCEAMVARRLDMLWECETRIDLVEPRLLEAMYQAGCRAIWFGVESARYDSLKTYEKNLKPEKILPNIRLIQDQGIRAGAFFIVGLPTETAEEVAAAVDYAIELGLDFSVYSIATPFPGTRMRERMYDQGVRNVSEDYSEYTESEAVWDTRHLTRREINLLLVSNYMRYYGRPEYVLERDVRRRLGLTRFVLNYVGELLEQYGVISSARTPDLGPPQRISASSPP